MCVTEENILKLFDKLGFPHKFKGYEYLIDLIIERDYEDIDGKRPTLDSMLFNLSLIVDTNRDTIRKCVDFYFEKASEVPVNDFGEEDDPLPWDKRLFIKMIASLSTTGKIELLYTMLKNMKEENLIE